MRGDEVRALTLDDDRDDARETTMRWCLTRVRVSLASRIARGGARGARTR